MDYIKLLAEFLIKAIEEEFNIKVENIKIVKRFFSNDSNWKKGLMILNMKDIIEFLLKPDVMIALTPILIAGILICIYMLKEFYKWLVLIMI